MKLDPVYWIWHHDVRTRNSLWGLYLVNTRANLLDSTKILEEAALDPYEFQRDAYLQRRRNLVYDGNPPPAKEDDLPEIKTKPRTETDEPVRPSGAALEPPRDLPGEAVPADASLTATPGPQTDAAQPADAFPPTI